MAAVAPARMVSACAPTKVRSVSSYRGEESLPRPDRVLVYDFAISPEEVSLNRGLFARFGREVTSASTTENELQIAREVADAFSTEPVKRIERLGLPAERAAADQVVPAGTLAQVALQTAHGPLLAEEFETRAESARTPAISSGSSSSGTAGSPRRRRDERRGARPRGDRLARSPPRRPAAGARPCPLRRWAAARGSSSCRAAAAGPGRACGPRDRRAAQASSCRAR